MNAEVSPDGLDGDSSISSGGEATSSKKVDPGFKRNLIVIGIVFVAAVLLLVGFVWMARGGAKAIEASKSNISLQESGAVPSSDGLTPAMREKLLRAQERESGEAAAKNQSYIPPDILVEKKELPPQQAILQQQQVHSQQMNDPRNDKRNQERLQAAQAMLAQMLQRPEAGRVQIARIEPASAPAAPASAASAAAASNDYMLVDIMEIFGARLTSPVDTDQSSFASAEITTGPLAGAQLVGTVKLAGTGVDFKFTGMRLDKRTYPINAVGLDEETSWGVVKGDLDRKLLSRYVFPVLMAYGGAYATARSQVATTTTSIGAGSLGDYGVSRPAPTEQQARAAGVAAAVQIGNQAVGKGASEPVRVRIDANTAIGVMFRDAVMASQSNSFKK